MIPSEPPVESAIFTVVTTLDPNFAAESIAPSAIEALVTASSAIAAVSTASSASSEAVTEFGARSPATIVSA